MPNSAPHRGLEVLAVGHLPLAVTDALSRPSVASISRAQPFGSDCSTPDSQPGTREQKTTSCGEARRAACGVRGAMCGVRRGVVCGVRRARAAMRGMRGVWRSAACGVRRGAA